MILFISDFRWNSTCVFFFWRYVEFQDSGVRIRFRAGIKLGSGFKICHQFVIVDIMK